MHQPFTPSQTIASMYQSPGHDGIGFARYASTGTVTPELWENIASIERQAAEGGVGREEWAEDMRNLRAAMASEGVVRYFKVIS